MRESDRAFDAGELTLAVRHARRAAALYVPGAAHVELGFERLVAVAVGAERARNPELAMTAWRAVRAAAIESRHVWLPHARELEQADLNLARLSGVPSAAVELVDADATRSAWVLMQSLGFAGALAGLFALSWRGVTRSGRVLWARVRLPGLLFTLGLVCFCVAVIRV
jgi:hypothetical protein